MNWDALYQMSQLIHLSILERWFKSFSSCSFILVAFNTSQMNSCYNCSFFFSMPVTLDFRTEELAQQFCQCCTIAQSYLSHGSVFLVVFWWISFGNEPGLKMWRGFRKRYYFQYLKLAMSKIESVYLYTCASECMCVYVNVYILYKM